MTMRRITIFAAVVLMLAGCGLYAKPSITCPNRHNQTPCWFQLEVGEKHGL